MTGKYAVIAGHKVRLLDDADREFIKEDADRQHVFIIGSKGIPAQYGGFETFVDKLTRYRKSDRIRYHVARMAEDNMRFEYNGAVCFDIKVPYIGSARAVVCDLLALRRCIEYCRERPQIIKPVFYVLACRIGPFIEGFRKEIHELGGTLLVNPDGHEWKRAKWSAPVRRYWKTSEGLMVRSADILICDSKNIEKYIRSTYRRHVPETRFIAYGSEVEPSAMRDDDPVFTKWLSEHGLRDRNYYLVVGRFVPENNFETMIREFMRSDTDSHELKLEVFMNNQELRELVNPVFNTAKACVQLDAAVGDADAQRLLEALGSTDLNLLLDVGFNKEVAEGSALYWNKGTGSLSGLISRADDMDEEEIRAYGNRAKERVREHYSWDHIVTEYEKLFLQQA